MIHYFNPDLPQSVPHLPGDSHSHVHPPADKADG